MKRFILPAVLVAVIVGLLLFIGYLLGGERLGLKPPAIGVRSEISAHTVVKEVLPIGEYASLAYHYTAVVKDINSRELKGWNIPFTTRKYIFTYDGVMKLGINGSKIRVEEGTSENEQQSVLVFLPPIQILSHEVLDDSVEVFEQSQSIFNEIKIDEAFKVTAGRKREMEEKVLAGDAIHEAEVSLEQQFGALLGGLPGIKNTYTVLFFWEAEEDSASAEAQTQL